MTICLPIPNNLQNGTVADASQVDANFDQIINNVNSNAAENGANASITSLSSLTTPLSQNQGGSNTYVGGTGAGTANAQTIATLVPSNFGLNYGNIVIFIPNLPNTGATTLSVNGTTATSIKKQANGGLVALVGTELQPLQAAQLFFDGIQYILLNPAPPVGDITYNLSSAPSAGKLLLNADTIGSASSIATHASAIFQNLYTYLWTLCSSPSSNVVCPVTGGLGMSAAADFAANKPLQLLTGANFSPMGIGSTVNAPGATAGAATVTPTGSITINGITLSASNIPTITSSALCDNADNTPGATRIAPSNTAAGGPQTVTGAISSNNTSGSSFTPTGSTSINAASVVHPVLGMYMFINY